MKSDFLGLSKDLSFVILYGSQLGQAESIAQNISNVGLLEHNLPSKVFTLNEIANLEDLNQLNCPVVIITSTTGDGEPPENADKFWRKIRRKSLSSKFLSSLKFSILGLGDTNFNNFCNCGKQIYKRLLELGAESYYPHFWVDDSQGLDDLVEKWISEIWPSLKLTIESSSESSLEAEEKNLSEKVNQSSLIKTAIDRTIFTIKSKFTNSSERKTEEVSSPSSSMDEKGEKITLPPCPSSSLEVEFCDEKPITVDHKNPPVPYPLIDDKSVGAKIINARFLTKKESVKTTLEITLQFLGESIEFEPGDALGFVCKNPKNEVEALISRLGYKEIANNPLKIKLKTGAKGKLPIHYPSITTILDCLTNFCDIRSVPKKAFLRLLAENCSNDKDKYNLLKLCSKEGSELYNQNIVNPSLSLLDILETYKSCSLDVGILLEFLPRLVPRLYSISSSPLKSANCFTIVFNLMKLSQESGRQYSRYGICTGWLYELSKKFLDTSDEMESLVKSFDNFDLSSTTNELIVFKRKNHNFRLSTDSNLPLIMVGPGAGVAPFIGFLEHREQLGIFDKPSFLYFGCRNKELDNIYETEINEFLQKNVLKKFHASFSRDEQSSTVKYVQHLMYEEKEELVNMLLDNEGYFYVCGDAKNMAKETREMLIICITEVKGISEAEAKEKVAKMILEKKYLQDVWM